MLARSSMAWQMPCLSAFVFGMDRSAYIKSFPATSATLPSLRNFPSLLSAMRTPAGDQENLYPRALSAAYLSVAGPYEHWIDLRQARGDHHSKSRSS